MKTLTYIIIATILSVLLLATCRLSAVEVTGLYQVSIPVKDQTSTTRWKAVLAGFREVLVRKSGNKQVLSAYEVEQAYRKVTAYLQRFEYKTNDNPQDSENSEAFVLQMHFEPRLIDELIQVAGMPIWGSNRPVTILWLAQEQNFEREMVKDDRTTGSLSSFIAAQSERRGIPVILPLMDLEDQLNVSISDIWGRFNGPILEASDRYQADSVVAGRISQIGDTWQAKLSYLNQGEQAFIDLSAQSSELLIEQVIDRLAELLCEKYCVVEVAESHAITFQISNVKNFKDFKQVQRYLESLSSIRQVEIEKISATNVRFNVALLGDLQTVIDGLALGKKLVRIDAPEIDPFAKRESVLTTERPTSVNPQVTDGVEILGTNTTVGDLRNNNEVGDVNNKQQNALTAALETLHYRWVE